MYYGMGNGHHFERKKTFSIQFHNTGKIPVHTSFKPYSHEIEDARDVKFHVRAHTLLRSKANEVGIINQVP